ncbi:hypothetical protein B0A49_05958 [Cryomyces minteri]|uniref:Uncharacterized protein n=1 Tax=Cryomyces minteri TaxID=331657 RepID=A0A4U0WWA7_9PEZI|nr:hypothetical protein B0A49_05958 [Cryomyces minteri]
MENVPYNAAKSTEKVIRAGNSIRFAKVNKAFANDQGAAVGSKGVSIGKENAEHAQQLDTSNDAKRIKKTKSVAKANEGCAWDRLMAGLSEEGPKR